MSASHHPLVHALLVSITTKPAFPDLLLGDKLRPPPPPDALSKSSSAARG